ncbi:hypothetical protein PROFUN_11173 [Planoprotostelium fungivorum]|uniref:Uncharacterized protein n=1 Tax=Planoprotostelium fungivorum TaxID=1890364 RepID=A0A2P6NAP9_9EUKA|nr:hypothetical protein PROFUN_11173 [Planoprotostelium fungivorum]
MESHTSATELYNLLQDPARPKIVIDVRPLEDYKRLAVRTSIHLSLDTQDPPERWTLDLLKTSVHCVKYFWNDTECELKESKDWGLRGLMFNTIVFVDNDGDSPAAIRLRELVIQEARTGVTSVTILQGGVHNFSSTYPFLCSSHSASNKAVDGLFPTELIQDCLYLGSYENATNLEQLNLLHITHVLNMGDELENKYPDMFNYLKCGLDDTSANNIAQFFEKCIEFIRNSGGRVLVHCAMGISRSSAISIAYMMRKNNWNFEKAKEFVRSQRSTIKPNDGFTAQLKEWQSLGESQQ